MRKHICLGLVCLFALSSAGVRAANEDVLKYLLGWVGEYPQISLQTKLKGPTKHTQNLWQDPNVIKMMAKSLGDANFKKMLNYWGGTGITLTPVEQIGDNISFFACKAHDCYDHQATVFLNLKTGLARVCWREGSEKKIVAGKPALITNDTWFFGNGTSQALASEGCEMSPPSRMLGVYDRPPKRVWPWEKWFKK